MIQLQIVSGLLNIIANVMHQDSQKYAANALIYLVQTFDYVADALVQHMGRNFFDLLEEKPDTFYRELTWEQVKYLRKNTVRINAGDQREEEDGDEDSGGSVTSDEEGAENGDGNSLLAVPERKSHRMSSHAEAVTPSAFPSNKNADLWDTPERVEATDQKKMAQANVNAQNQNILDEYEKNQSDEALVEDLYVPYGSAASNVTFAGAKFKKGGVADYSEKFNQELDEFRKSNIKKSLKEKEEFQVKFDEDMTKRLNRVKKEPGLFTKQQPALPKI
ncbi:hypothetical protein HDU81_011380 [Chytriomyces hyalinus]|nr:hypothetical protein HDU81_011380 [Chytriomyces hyalinus]